MSSEAWRGFATTRTATACGTRVTTGPSVPTATSGSPWRSAAAAAARQTRHERGEPRVRTVNDRPSIHPTSRAEWRQWLERHHQASDGVNVVQWRRVTGKPRLSYDDLVEEALCFGWIDSRYRRLDDQRSSIMMTPRRPTSVWAASNKE